MSLSEMVRQSGRLADDLQAIERQVREQLPGLEPLLKRRHYLAVGSGDSSFAARAAALAWRELAEVAIDCYSPQSLLYSPPSPDSLLVATSASGRSPAILRALEAARSATLAVTSAPESRLSALADGTVEMSLGNCGPSPGVRTYQASLVAHLCLASAAGEARGVLSEADAARKRAAIVELAPMIGSAVDALSEPCARLASILAGADVVTVLGSGPHLGTAQYAAAKLVEAAGMLAIATDPEEWWHVERFAGAVPGPLIILCPWGPSFLRAMEVAEAAQGLGHHVTVVGDPARCQVSQAIKVLPVSDAREEWLSPVLQALIAPLLAARIAGLLGRVPFQARGGGLASASAASAPSGEAR